MKKLWTREGLISPGAFKDCNVTINFNFNRLVLNSECYDILVVDVVLMSIKHSWHFILYFVSLQCLLRLPLNYSYFDANLRTKHLFPEVSVVQCILCPSDSPRSSSNNGFRSQQ